MHRLVESSGEVDPVDQARVTCDYDESLQEDLISALGRKVELAGEFELTDAGNYRITKIERFRVLDTEDTDL